MLALAKKSNHDGLGCRLPKLSGGDVRRWGDRMNKLWKIATSPTVEDAAKDVFVKNMLTNELANAVRALQQDALNKQCSIASHENASSVCNCIEAIFIHGLKDRLTNKVYSLSSVFGTGQEKLPDPDFWPLVMVYSHRDVLKEITKLSNIVSDVGHCRAWLRLALNDGLMLSYLDTMLKDKTTLQCYYRAGAYLRDDEQPDIMRRYMEGLSGFSFQLPYNCSSLNSWSVIPLQLAGIWTLPVDLEPVMPAVDVAACIDEDETKISSSRGRKKPRDSSAKRVVVDAGSNKNDDDNNKKVSEKRGPKPMAVRVISPDSSRPSEELVVKDEGIIDDGLQEDNGIVYVSKEDAKEEVEEEPELIESPEKPQIFTRQTSYGTPDPSVLNMLHESKAVGEENNCQSAPMSPIGQLSDSWSSAITDEKDLSTRGSIDNQSYNVLLFSYTQNHGGPLVDTSELLNTSILEKSEYSEDESANKGETSSLDSLEFEVVPKHLAIFSQKVDPETKTLIEIMGAIPREKGLDTQQCKCKGCERPVGMIYGKSRVCAYDGYHYCYECHENDENVIPSRIVHNWDFARYPVSKRAKAFLVRVEEEPLLNVKALNPQLYSVIQEMAKLQYLRVELNFLKSYLLTCRDTSGGEALRRLVWPREYLYEHVHLYAVADLLQAKSGALVQLLQKAVAFCKKHVYGCELCSQKGYICEVCNNPQVIYPFEVTTTYHCEACSAVYHSRCMADGKPCPKCERRRKREQT